MRTFLFNFKKQFAPLVASGAKCQTVRATRKDGRVPVVGDIAKCYTGLRTSSTRLLLAAPVVESSKVLIDFRERTLALNGARLDAMQAEHFAKADGFGTFAEMLRWFRETHREDSNYFEGFFTRWLPEGKTSSEDAGR